MPICLLVRHGHSTANEAGELAGWRAGVHLTETGRAQADAAADLVDPTGPVRIVSSPLDRCRETAGVLAHRSGLTLDIEAGLGECHYGTWTGRPLRELAADPLWRRVQDHPEQARFEPSADYRGESLTEMAGRITSTLRGIDDAVAVTDGADAVWIAVSHGDPIKAALAGASGGGVAQLQRFHVDPGSVSVVRRWGERTMVLATNLRTGPLVDLVRASTPAAAGSAGDALPGGGAG